MAFIKLCRYNSSHYPNTRWYKPVVIIWLYMRALSIQIFTNLGFCRREALVGVAEVPQANFWRQQLWFVHIEGCRGCEDRTNNPISAPLSSKYQIARSVVNGTAWIQGPRSAAQCQNEYFISCEKGRRHGIANLERSSQNKQGRIIKMCHCKDIIICDRKKYLFPPPALLWD